VAVTDGDTVRVLTASQQQIRVRLAFIDAPEKGQAFGQRAKQAMSELVFGKDVERESHTIDRYGRLVAVVYVDGTDAGLELLKAGLCWVYERYVVEASAELQARYRNTQEMAQVQRAGL
jgi:micrococcal nuclease